MRIAYILPSLANRGPIVVVRDLVDVMIAHGHNCVVYYLDDKKEIYFKCPVIKIELKNKIPFNEFDVIHSHGIRPDFYVWLHKPMKCKTLCVSTLHSYIFQDLESQYNKLIAIIMGRIWMGLLFRFDYVAVLSNAAKKYYQKILPKNKIRVAYNTRIIDARALLSLKEEKKILAFKGNDFLIGVNAMLSPIKGIDLLIKAIPFIEGCKLWIVGDGKSKEDLKALAKKERIEDRIYFAGYQKNAFRYMPYYDVYAMTSRCEGFGLVLLEAAYYSIPTVCSDIPIFRELFSENEVSFFHLNSESSLVNAINNAKGNRQMATKMNERYRQCYSTEYFYRQYLEIYTCH